jgi:hypothetical protein
MDKRLAGLRRLISSDPENPANYQMMIQALERINKSGSLPSPNFYVVFMMNFFPVDEYDEEDRTQVRTRPIGPFERNLNFKVRPQGKSFNSRTLLSRIKEKDWTRIDPCEGPGDYEFYISSRMEYGQPFEIAWVQNGIIYPTYDVYQAQFYQNFYLDHLTHEGTERIHIDEDDLLDFMENISFDEFYIFATYETPEELERRLNEDNNS